MPDMPNRLLLLIKQLMEFDRGLIPVWILTIPLDRAVRRHHKKLVNGHLILFMRLDMR